MRHRGEKGVSWKERLGGGVFPGGWWEWVGSVGEGSD